MANKKPDVAKSEVVAKPKYKVNLCTNSSNNSATIYRPDMPYIIDNKEEAVRWLAANGYKAEDIGVEGEKPANWNTVFPPPVVPETTPMTEVLAEVLNKPSEPIPNDSGSQPPVETVAV
jgi:hypothetical protein